MKSNLVVVGVVAALGLAMFVHMTFFPPEGIIAWDDYEHAVALCEKQDQLMVGTQSSSGEATFFVGRNYFMTINKGHENDVQVNHLKVLALVECDKLAR